MADKFDRNQIKQNCSYFRSFKFTFILLSKAIVEAIVSGVTSALNTLLIIIVVLLFLVGSAFLITYLVQKKNGMLDSYEAFSDIMTEEEFKHWQERKKRKQR